MIKKVSIFSFLAALLISIFPAAVGAAADSTLTDTGDRAFQDLTRCISTKKILDVYYLIDQSGSLKHTDVKDDRADILAASLSALGDFQNGVKVSYAVTFFGDGTDKWANWSEVNKSTIDSKAAALRAEIKKPSRKNDSNTDWLAGLQQAQTDLAAQAKVSHGCQALIWLTDGGIDLQEGTGYGAPHNHSEDRTNLAVSTLCNDVMPALRRSNVSVFGVLLKNDKQIDLMPPDQREYTLNGMPHLYPLVEGKSEGTLEGTTLDSRECGYPIPDRDAAGAVLIAKDPVELALQFMVLTAATQGGIEGNLPPGNPTHFTIDKGVRRFELVTTSKSWTLTGPNSKSYGAGTPGVTIGQSGSIATISVDVGTLEFGKWEFGFKEPAQNKLFLFSGLDVEINKSGFVAGENGTLSGSITTLSTLQPVDLSAYKPSPVKIDVITASGKADELTTLTAKNNGKFSFNNFRPMAGEKQIELRITMNLTTTGGTKLKPISVTRIIEVPDRSHYPTLEIVPIKFSDAQDVNPGKGLIKILPPQVGSGKVCFETAQNNGVTTDSDEFKKSRVINYVIKGLPADGCVHVSGEPKTLTIEASTRTPGEAAVTATLPMTSYSDSEANGVIKDEVPMELKTTLEKAWEWLIRLLLYVLGIALPWIFSYVQNRSTTKIAFGPKVQRAVLPVMVHSTKGVTAVDGGTVQVRAEDFKFIPEQESTTVYRDQLGEMRAKVSFNVLRAPWFEIAANPGYRFITMLPVPALLKKRFATGQIAPMKGNIDTFWALQISDADLINPGYSTAIPATLLIYKRNKLSQPNQHVDVVMKATQTPGIWSVISALPKNVEAIAVKAPKDQPKVKEMKGGTTPPPPPPAGGVIPPPPPGMAPPPPIPPSL